MKGLQAVLLIGVLSVGCGSSDAEPTPGAGTAAAPGAVEVTCGDYEAQMDHCAVRCREYCDGPTPGNACASCQSECADQIFCDQCDQSDFCTGEE
ncbi:MAG: hypothetical protein KC619_26920 [Myxococcales bacterium]|nr:hypothetical protein [Myxococcales bacterium]